MDNENGVVSEAEVEAALAEARAHAEAIPSLDEETPNIVPVPITSHLRPLPRSAATAPPIATAAGAPTTTSPAAAASAGDVASVPTDHGLLFRVADRILWAINRPFAFLGRGGRQVVGWAAIVTLILSALAPALLPRLFPRRDRLSELRRYTQQALRAPQTQQAAETH